MKITKVTYQKTYSIGPYLTERIGFEADITQSESVIEALVALNAEADIAHKTLNPHLYEKREPIDISAFAYKGLNVERSTSMTPDRSDLNTSPPVINLQDEQPNPGLTLNAIQRATTLEELQTYKLMASSDPTKTLYTAYCERLKQLTNGQG